MRSGIERIKCGSSVPEAERMLQLLCFLVQDSNLQCSYGYLQMEKHRKVSEEEVQPVCFLENSQQYINDISEEKASKT